MKFPRFICRLGKEPEKELNTVETMLKAMKMLEEKGIFIQTIAITKELEERMTSGRKAIDKQYKKDPFGLMFMDNEFAPFVSAKEFGKSKKPKEVIGMMFGINIIIRR